MEYLRNYVQAGKWYILFFCLGFFSMGSLVLTHGISIGVFLINLGEHIAMAGGAEPIMTKEDIEVLVYERMAEFARNGQPNVLKVVRK